MLPTDRNPHLVIDSAKRRKVRAVAKENSPQAEALFTLAAGTKQVWSRAEWDDVLAGLDVCEDSIEDWLSIRE